VTGDREKGCSGVRTARPVRSGTPGQKRRGQENQRNPEQHIVDGTHHRSEAAGGGLVKRFQVRSTLTQKTLKLFLLTFYFSLIIGCRFPASGFPAFQRLA